MWKHHAKAALPLGFFFSGIFGTLTTLGAYDMVPRHHWWVMLVFSLSMVLYAAHKGIRLTSKNDD